MILNILVTFYKRSIIRFVDNIEIAYKCANRTLLDLLLKDQQLIARLRYTKFNLLLL